MDFYTYNFTDCYGVRCAELKKFNFGHLTSLYLQKLTLYLKNNFDRKYF